MGVQTLDILMKKVYNIIMYTMVYNWLFVYMKF